jgi:GT2 family glycosyltransferase
VYVDSGSTDGSVPLARERSAEICELDLSIPFTAARARNEGFARLVETSPGTELVQFVDGDCELVRGWIERATAELDNAPDLAVVCGRRQERDREATVYNRLCDMEWDTELGDVASCGGDALMRVDAFRAVGGYNPAVIAGEEPELCVRLRAAGHRIRRIDAPMTLHDAAMTRFTQWWQRAKRHGHSAAESAARHGEAGGTGDVRRIGSALFWGLVLPVGALATTVAGTLASSSLLAASPIALALVAYAALMLRIARRRSARGDATRDVRAYALFCVLGKLPESLGAVRYHTDRLRGRASPIIEYK